MIYDVSELRFACVRIIVILAKPESKAGIKEAQLHVDTHGGSSSLPFRPGD